MDFLASAPITACFTKATLAAGTTTTFSTTNATIYAIRSKFYTTSAASNGATPTSDVNTGATFLPVPLGYGCVFVFCYDGSSTTATTAIKVAQGQITPLNGANDDGTSALNTFVTPPGFPAIKDTLCPFGYLVVKVGSGGSVWTFGANNLSSVTKVGFAFQDICTLPDRPQVS